MNLLTNRDLASLINFQNDYCITVYLPTVRAGAEVRQGRIRLKNLVREAEDPLINGGMRTPQAHSLLEPLKKLNIDDQFWQHQKEGLAIFLAPGFLAFYHLPFRFEESLHLGTRFYLKPVLPLLTGDGLYYVLALSQNSVRLLQCTREGVKELELDNVPKSLAEALQYDDPEKQLQYHSNSLEGTGQQSAAIFHGHGAGIDDSKDNILRYFRQVDRGLREVLREETSPLFLAAVGFLHSIYREANTYTYLAGQGITGNPDEQGPENLQSQTWPLAEQYFLQSEKEAWERFSALQGTGKTTVDIREAAPAAFNGRIEVLFLARDASQWGSFDSQHNNVILYEQAQTGAEDLLDFTAIQTIINGGKVYVLAKERIPGACDLAALFRY
jgi:hypothetical protein